MKPLRSRMLRIASVLLLTIASTAMLLADDTAKYQAVITEATAQIESDASDWRAYQRRAEAHAALSQYDRAIADLTQVLALDSGNVTAQRRLAEMYQRNGSHSRAVIEYARAFEMTEDVQQRVNILLARARVYKAINLPNRQRSDIEAAIALQPQNIDLKLQLIELHTQQGNDTLADRMLDELIAHSPDDVRPHLARVRIRMERRQYSQALQLCNETIKAGHTTADAYALRSDIHERLDNYEEALRDANAALQLDPNHLEALKNRGRTWSSLGEPLRAVADYEKALAIDPNYTPVQNNLALVLMNDLDSPQKAMELLTQGIRNNPDGGLYNNRAVLHQKLGNMDAALDDYAAALRIEPNEPNAGLNIARLLYHLERYEEAYDACTRNLERHPDSAATYYFRGSIQRRMPDHEGAEADFNACLALDPDYVDAYRQRGMLYGDRAQWDKAARDLEIFLDRKPDHANALAHLARVYYRLNRHDQGLATAQRSLAINPQESVALHYGAHCLQSLQRHEQAVQHLDQLIPTDPHDSHLLTMRAFSLRQLKRYEEAVRDCDAALKQSPHDSEARYERARAYLEMGREGEALVDLEMAISKRNDARFFATRGQLYAKRLETKKAIQDLARAAQIQPNSNNYYYLAQALCADGQLPQAYNAYNEAAKLAPTNTAIRSCRALLAASIGEHTSAMADCNMVMPQKPLWARFMRAHCHLMNNDPAAALADAEWVRPQKGLGQDGWTVMIGYLAAQQLGDHERAKAMLADWTPNDAVPRHCIRYLRGEMTAEELQATGETDYARVYIDTWLGYEAYLRKDMARAQQYFQRAADNPRNQQAEYVLARHMLVRVTRAAASE